MRNILVISPAWLGDIIMSQSLLKTLKRLNPGCHIDVYAPAYAQGLLERMPECNGRLVNPFAHGEFNLKKRFTEGRRLRLYRYDACFVLPNSFKSALPAFFAGIRERHGFTGESRFVLLNRRRGHKERFPLMVERYVALAYSPAQVPDHAALPAFDYPALSPRPAAALWKKLALPQKGPFLALGCGSNFGPAKLWPPSYFAEVSSWWADSGGQVLALGSRGDSRITRRIISHLGERHRAAFHDLAGRTTLTEALDLIGRCTAAVCNDSGLMHLVAAAGVPQVCLFGSTSTAYTPPLSTRAVCLESGEPCHPCFKRTCRFGTNQCLKSLRPAQVLTELAAMLKDSRR